MAAQTDGLLSAWLQRQRITVARPFIRSRVLDYGCGVGALAAVCHPDRYVGIDEDQASLKIARRRFPGFRFEESIPRSERFDTITLLAVLEHVADPGGLLRSMKALLSGEGRLVATTPHPASRLLHAVGSAIGLFSRHAHRQHQQLLDYRALTALSAEAGLVIHEYRRFELGLNQLVVLGPRAEGSADH